MNWPWSKPPPAHATDEAEEAATYARRILKDARNFDLRTEVVLDHARKVRERNHIAAAVINVVRGDD